MKAHSLLPLIVVSLFCVKPVWAVSPGSFTINNTGTTTPQTLNAGGTGIITSTGSLIVSGSSVAVTMTDTSTITNSGTIEQTGTGRDIRITGTNASSVYTITNNAGGLITAVGSDAFQMKTTGTVTIYNYGTFSTTTTLNLAGTSTGSGDQGLNMNILGSNGIGTAYSGVVYNYSGGVISAQDADAVRLGAGNTLYNSGTIQSVNAAGNTSSSDGIDAQVNNTGITIVNGASQTNTGTTTSANLIEGARHGITGGQQVDSIDTLGSSKGNSNGAYDQAFTMSITNGALSTIKGDNGSGINIDGVDGTEVVTVVNAGLISGTGVTADGDGVDVDGVVNITNSGTIISTNAINDTSEGITVGGGTIVNTSTGLIEGSATLTATNTTAVGRGITLGGIDHTETNGVETDIPIQKIYATTTIFNAGLIKGDSDSGIAILGITGTTNYSVTITNTAGGMIEGAGSVAAIDGSALANGEGTASSNNETVINYGTIKADNAASGAKAISLGMGLSNTVQIMGGAAHVFGDMSGGLTGTNTANLIINPSAGQSFSYGGVISNFGSVEIVSGTVTFSGANTYTGNTTIDAATLDLTGAGSIGTTGTLTIASGGVFDLGGGSVTVGSLINSGTINDGTVNTTSSGTVSNLSGNTSFNKSSPGTTTINGTNTYTGGTTVSAGKLAVNGSITGTVIVNAGAEVGGNGTIGGTITGSGSVGPGNSPGVLTAASVNPTAGLNFNFELTLAGTAAWASPSNSGNDVLHLTSSMPFTAPLSSSNGNSINLYFAALGVTYEGGFFVNGTLDNLTSNISGANYNYYVLDASGAFTYNGQNYDQVTGTASTLLINGVDFGDGNGQISGYTESFTASAAPVPEPSTYVLLGIGALGLLLLGRRTSRRS